MIFFRVTCYILFFVPGLVFSQQRSELITVKGDSLVGKSVNGEAIREVFGNVVLTQGNVIVNCNQAIQYISRNNAELIGNVIVKQDSLTIETQHGFYYGDLRKTRSTTGVRLDDQKVILTADSGEYFFDLDKAFFQSDVRLYDTATTLTSNELTYFQKENRAVATGLVKIVDEDNAIFADTLEHFRDTKITFAFSNVRIQSLKNNIEIYGEHLEDYREKDYTIVDVNPLLTQVDTTYTRNDFGEDEAKLDTLFISAGLMEAFRDSSDRFIAKDSVKIIRDKFSSKNDLSIYYRTKEQILTEKLNDNRPQPVMWFENSQLTGDSITIYLKDNNINRLDVNGNAFMLSQNKKFQNRFDQTSSSDLKIYFDDNQIKKTEFFGNVYSIYYLYEDEEANGLIKSNSKDATIYFVDNDVDEVKLYQDPATEYYPEKQVFGNEKSYLLPRFIFISNRPDKSEMYKMLERLK